MVPRRLALPDHGDAVGLTWIARFLPLTHALALMRYGLNGDSTGLHAIWRMGHADDMAALSLLVLAGFALLLLRVAVRVFTGRRLRNEITRTERHGERSVRTAVTQTGTDGANNHGAFVEQSGRKRARVMATGAASEAAELPANRRLQLHPLASDPRW